MPFGKVLPQQAIGVLVRPALPRALRIAKIYVDFGRQRKATMNGEEPRLFGVEPPRPRPEAVRIVDMSASNSWAELAATFRRTRPAYQELKFANIHK